MKNVPGAFDVDLAGVGVGDDGEGLLRDVDGSTASRGAEVDDPDGDAPAGAQGCGTPSLVAPVHRTT
jgi:hypothetical protein